MNDRRIVLGVSGGVAAYKSAYLARRLLEQGADVRVVMTASAQEFIGRQTLAAITKHPVLVDLFGGISPHTELGQWAELVIVAPATAHTMSKIAYGISGDALAATVLASDAPVLIAPAMHTEMWQHPATVATMAALRSAGHTIVGPEAGELAGGDVGYGRMAEPEDIVFAAKTILSGQPLGGRRVVVTAGGTREPIDPVRYIGNRSSGKMGHAIAEAAAQLGAVVTLVTSSGLPTPAGIERLQVETADQMANAAWQSSIGADCVILAAAVADFKPEVASDHKLRRIDGAPQISLTETPNVLAGVVAMDPKPFVVGFAAQTGSLEDAKRKATTYGVDLLVANDVAVAGRGFGTDTNEVTLMWPDGSTTDWELAPKTVIAHDLMMIVSSRLDT